MKRRDFLKTLAAMGIYGAFSPFATNKVVGNTIKKSSISGSRVKSVIEIWVWGGPSQLETFDPKPKAGFEFNGGFGAIPTNVPGFEVSSFMPKLAQHADKYSVIRSMTHPYFGHESATYLMQTGRVPGGGRTFPAIGALFARFKGHEYQGKLPPYIALTINKGRFSENGFLSDRYRPLATGGNPAAPRFVVDGFVPPGDATPEEIKKRQQFARELDILGNGIEHPEFLAFDKAGNEALEIINGSFWKGKEKALSSRAGIYPGVNLFNLNYVLLRKRIESIPGIEKAEVVRILPDKLQIKVVERIPRAVLFIPSGAYVVDENGIVIPRAESAVHGSLPVITTIPGRRSFKLGECLDTLQPSLELIMTVLRNFPDIDIECVMPGSKEELNFYMRYRSGKRYLVTLPLNNSKNLPYLLSALQTTIINIHWKQVNISHINLLYNGRVVLK